MLALLPLWPCFCHSAGVAWHLSKSGKEFFALQRFHKVSYPETALSVVTSLELFHVQQNMKHETLFSTKPVIFLIERKFLK